jgi:hypothetical protein
VATSEPVVLHHGREGGVASHDEARPSVFNGLLDSESSIRFDAPKRLIGRELQFGELSIT